MLCDTGPIVALIDTSDARHEDCKDLIPFISDPLVTTWPCLTEAMYFLGKKFGFHKQRELWQLIESGAIRIHDTFEDESLRMHHLMQKYQNVPMDLADASLVTAAESLNLTRIFTLDAHFRIYRIKDKIPFEIVP